jgi:hypothetical protein
MHLLYLYKLNNMKNLIVTIILLIFFTNSAFSQISTEKWNKITQEAYLNFIQNGGSSERFRQNQEKIVQDYMKKNYSYNNSGEIENRSILDARRMATVGAIYSGVNMVGQYSNGIVRRGMNQVGSYYNNYFYAAGNRCIGKISGSNILDCNGNVLFTVNQRGVLKSSGQQIFTINGDQLISFGGGSVSINGISMESLAAYLLFF